MAQRRTHVPKFGNWDANDPVPYTAVFDHARAGRGKHTGNPNDPSENPGNFGGRVNGNAPGRRIVNPNDPEDMDAADLHQERQGNREGRGQQPVPLLPKPSNEAPARRQVAAVPPQASHPDGRNSAMPSRPPPTDYVKRPAGRENVGSTESASTSVSADQSPSHALGNQGRTAGRLGGAGGNSPAWENRRRPAGEEAQNLAPPTPNRSRLRSGNSKPEDPQKGAAALPKFGEWDQNPQAGDGFTMIFNNARHERRTGGPVRIPQPGDGSNDDDLYKPPLPRKSHGSRKWFCCCSSAVDA